MFPRLCGLSLTKNVNIVSLNVIIVFVYLNVGPNSANWKFNFSKNLINRASSELTSLWVVLGMFVMNPVIHQREWV